MMLLVAMILVVGCRPHQKNQTQEPVNDSINLQKPDDDLRLLLKNLSVSDVNSISMIADQLEQLPPNARISDDLFVDLKQFMTDVIEEFNEHFMDNYADVQQDLWSDKKTERLAELNALLAKNGLELNAAEGNYYAQWQPTYFPKLFDGRISESLTSFLSIQKKEEENGYATDGYLLISYDELADRVLVWEQFLKDYPEAYISDEARQNYNNYLMILMAGIDNSPVQDVDTSQLLPEIKALYLRIIEEHPGTHTAKSLKAYYEYLAQRQFKLNPEVYQYVQQYKI